MTHGSASSRKQASHVQQTHTESNKQQTQINSVVRQTQIGSEVKQHRPQSDVGTQDQQRASVYPEAYRKSDVTPNLKRRARRLAVDGRVDHQTRGMIRYALENKDPYLRQLVTRIEAGEMRIDRLILIDD